MELSINKSYDLIVVGGGHAGIEAAAAGAKIGIKVLLITSNILNIGSMPCNPSLGGPAKGIVVREIDALGGVMAKIGDATTLQIKMLNLSKGPGVHSLRAQIDKIEYQKKVQVYLKTLSNLEILEDEVKDLIIKDKECQGVITTKEKINSKKVIITTGTYMEPKILVGHIVKIEGPDGEKPSIGLSKKLKEYGHKIIRLKTGTPPRIAKDSIDYTKTSIELGHCGEYAFSFSTKNFLTLEEQVPCFLIHSNEATHSIIKDNLEKSAMYGGLVEGIGPRYCPSIEDKIMRFADKERHQLFLELESKSLNTIYLQGFSTSMPIDIQDKMIRSLPGLENAEVIKYAYAIEYDALDPLELTLTLESKLIKSLYLAGQIIGTSGYEEAAGLGLMAGINAANSILGREPLILKRSEAYIGVMIDDIMTKGIKDPYRLLTSRAEYRLMLRHDNADERLMKYGHQVNLLDDSTYQECLNKYQLISKTITDFKEISFKYNDGINDLLISKGYPSIVTSLSIYEILKRPGIEYDDLLPYLDKYYHFSQMIKNLITIKVKYQGYIEKQESEIARFIKYESIKIPVAFDYDKVEHLASEARVKLNQVRPETIGQASRISGVNPADIGILIRYFK